MKNYAFLELNKIIYVNLCAEYFNNLLFLIKSNIEKSSNKYSKKYILNFSSNRFNSE